MFQLISYFFISSQLLAKYFVTTHPLFPSLKIREGGTKKKMDEYKTIKQLARELRKNQTGAEEMLWQKLRNRKLYGYKFLRQHPIIHSGFINKLYFFIADFYCAEKELVIEIDGKIYENQYTHPQPFSIYRKGLGVSSNDNRYFSTLSISFERRFSSGLK